MKALCYDPTWKFNKHTDLAKTFAKERRRLAAMEAQEQAEAEAETDKAKRSAKVTSLKRGTK